MAEAGDDVYPFSDPRGTPLPFDIGYPEGLWVTAVAVAASAELTLPDTWEIVVMFATVATVVGFGTGIVLDLTLDTEKVDHQILPANTPVTVKLPAAAFKTISADGASTGKLYIQKYRRWKAASQSVQQRNL